MFAGLEPVDDRQGWDERRARHLLNRAGFGVPGSAVAVLEKGGASQAVAMMVDYDRFTDNLEEPDWFQSAEEVAELRRQAREAEPEERNRIQNQIRRRQREDVDQLKTWWLDRMRYTRRPLQEKLTLFWHGHFATSAEKVNEPEYNYGMNSVLRENAAGNFRDLVFEAGKTPAMLMYLDNRNNRKGKPNENWSRELMELFTIGIGNYTEMDIKEAARAFSGYTLKNGKFVFEERQHDFGKKTFMGKSGDFDGRDIINMIMEQPETARHIAKKLWEFFVYENPSEELVDSLGKIFRDADYELKPLLRTMFRSKEFYSAKAMEGLVKSPAQYLVMLMDHLKAEAPRRAVLTLAMRGLGQELFYPPNVKGWDGNRAWINTNTLLLRYNIPLYITTGERPDYKRDERLDVMPGAAATMDGDAMMGEPVMVNQQQEKKRSREDIQKAAKKRAEEARKEALQKATQKRQAAQQNGKASMAAKNSANKSATNRAKPIKYLVDFGPTFAPYIGKSVPETLQQINREFLAIPLDAMQLNAVQAVLGLEASKPGAIFTEELAKSAGPVLLHHLFSTAEYQIC